MKSTISLFSAAFLATAASSFAQRIVYPVPQLVNNSTGLMESKVAGDWYRGSAVVARDPKLIYSCAHLFYESGRWADDYYFHRAYNAYGYPKGRGVEPRGLNYFSGYSSGVRAYGTESARSFALDFTVSYGYSGFGPAASCWKSGASALLSDRPKQIVGYPSEIDYTWEPGHCWQHATPWFNSQGFRVLSGYFDIDGVTTGAGNSGGPVFVQNPTGDPLLAGILVSGTIFSSGVVTLDLSTNTMAGYALGLKDKTVNVSNTESFALPDGGSFVAVPLKVSGFSGSLSKAKISVAIAAKRRGDLMVYLRAPNGRISWLTRLQGGSNVDLKISGRDISSRFFRINPNGTWTLFVRDAVAKAPSKFLSATLSVSALR